jgi:3',5'-cyclic AMP phosphodiesterase CpdA
MDAPQDSVPATAVRLAHFSDLHLTAPQVHWRPADWLSKRLTGWFNLRWLGRGYRFRQADAVVVALMQELRSRRLLHVVFSGDATSLGFEEEVARAAALLGVGSPDALPGLAVPGNHDYYTRGAARSGTFERHFAPWQQGERIDQAIYPFAQRVGPLWLVGVNSCTGNRWAWDAAGRVGLEQLGRLQALLGRLAPGPRILVTHYPICLASGRLEPRHHGLRDLADVLTVAKQGNICLWLHGHRHGDYHLACSQLASFPVVCAGTATEQGRWSYGLYTVEGRHFHAQRRVFCREEGRFQDGEAFDLELRC